MADIVRAVDSETGQVVNIDLTPQWSPAGSSGGKEQQAVIEGNAKYTGDTRMKGKPCSEIPPGFAPPRGWQGCSHGFMAPHLVWPQQTLVPAQEPVAPVKRGRGRPKGSKNKPKTFQDRVDDLKAKQEREARIGEVHSVKIVEDVRDQAIPGATPAERVAAFRAASVDADKLAAVIKALKDAGLV